MTGGSVTLIRGCMFAGKTARLIDLLTAARRRGESPRAFKHALDARYSPGALATHDGRSFPALELRDAAALRAAITAAEPGMVAVDEVQFFGEATVPLCDELRKAGYRLVLAGIDFDTWGRPFSPLPELAQTADEVVTLTIPCGACGQPARLNQRVTPIVGGNLIGGPGDYEPRCVGCFTPARVAGLPAGVQVTRR